MSDLSQSDAGGLTTPVSILVEKIANAFGRHFDPQQTVRMAEAEAKAYQIVELGKADTDTRVAELRHRAAARFANEEMTKQANMESIIEKASKYVTDDAKPEDMEDDWIRNVLDKCRIVSDDDMKNLWARILAGEANNPGSFSRRTVNLVADLDKRNAELFWNLCRFVWTVQGRIEPLIFDEHHEIYNHYGITFDSLAQLETLGLIRFGGVAGFKLMGLPQTTVALYYGRPVSLVLKKNSENDLETGKVFFTEAGHQLARICDTTPDDEFFDYVYKKWASESLVSPKES